MAPSRSENSCGQKARENGKSGKKISTTKGKIDDQLGDGLVLDSDNELVLGSESPTKQHQLVPTAQSPTGQTRELLARCKDRTARLLGQMHGNKDVLTTVLETLRAADTALSHEKLAESEHTKNSIMEATKRAANQLLEDARKAQMEEQTKMKRAKTSASQQVRQIAAAAATKIGKIKL